MAVMMNIYLNRTCSKCESKGTTANGLCLKCQGMDKPIMTEMVSRPIPCNKTSSEWVGQWVRRSVAHDIEHHVARANGSSVIMSCGQRMPAQPLVAAVSAKDSNYRCVTCSNLVDGD